MNDHKREDERGDAFGPGFPLQFLALTRCGISAPIRIANKTN